MKRFSFWTADSAAVNAIRSRLLGALRIAAAAIFVLGGTTIVARAADTVAPTVPGNLTVTPASSTQLNLTWDASTDNVAVTGYLIERCKDAGCTNFAQIANVTTLSYSNTGLVPAASYSYRIRARDAANNRSAYTSVITVSTPPDTQAPTPPANVTVSATSNVQLVVTWAAATDDVKVTGYMVERCQGMGCTAFAQVSAPGANAVSYTNNNLTPNTSYSYRVRAKDAANNIGNYSPVGTGSTLPDTLAPTAPSGLTATVASNTRINLAWTAATDDVKVTGYRVERCAGVGCTNFAEIATPTGVSYANTGLTAGSNYSYRVRATDGAGNLGPYTGIVSATTTGTDTQAPSVPVNLSATLPSATQVNLTWTASTDNNTLAGYRVERCQGVGCTNFVQVGTPASNSFNDPGRSPTTTYRYRVRAIDAANNLSGYSSILTANTGSGVVDCD